MIPCYRLDLLRFGTSTTRRVFRDVGWICAWSWAAFILYVIGRGL